MGTGGMPMLPVIVIAICNYCIKRWPVLLFSHLGRIFPASFSGKGIWFAF
jgi:hypothetical protein